ncbi:MAG TPA: flagellar biosynthesis protein FlhF [Bacillales bacterium]|nr:flagellar biosynthesis protein FlhF [Bacillales bacterium]
MKVKKFTAPSMPEAMKQIRHDLGEEAVILNSKEVETGGFLGFFAKKQLEVIAAVDPEAVPVKAPSPVSTSFAPVSKREENHWLNESDDLIGLRNDIRRMKVGRDYPGPLADVRDRLDAQEVEEQLTEGIMKPLVREWYKSDESMEKERVFQSLHETLNHRLLEKAEKPFDYEKQYLLLAGPTGVGKTTTLAKIAAKAQLEDQKEIAFITADTYRIAAVDQLKAYADILSVPLEVAYTKEDFLKAKEKFADRDLVLVDSAGRNFREGSYIEELKRLIPFGSDMETWLVLSLTSKYQDMLAIFQKFAGLSPDRCVLTKVDETQSYGAVLNFWLRNGIPPAFLTNGQNVPDDLIRATPERIAGMLSGVKNHA